VEAADFSAFFFGVSERFGIRITLSAQARQVKKKKKNEAGGGERGGAARLCSKLGTKSVVN
jgi:hypothetical protein